MTVGVSYLVCSSPRTGSTVLCDSLGQTGLCGMPRGYFLPAGPALTRKMGATADPDGDFLSYLRNLAETVATPNRVFGAKVMRPQFEQICAKIAAANGEPCDARPAPEWLEMAFPGVRYVWVRRKDHLRQAISMWKAKQTEVFHRWDGRPGAMPLRTPVYSFTEIRKIRDRFVKDAERWEQFFAEHGIAPCVQVYESFSQDLPGCVRQVLDFLGLDSVEEASFPPSAMEKLADDESEAWCHRFLQEERNPRFRYEESDVVLPG